MEINPYKFPFIVLEGIDGCGKSSQTGRLMRWFEAKTNISAFFTFEPTNGVFGKKSKEIILSHKGTPAEELQMTIIKDRKEHRRKETEILKIKPIISDRDFLSAFAYGISEGLGLLWVYNQHEIILGDLFFIPDLILIIDIEPARAMDRKLKNGKRFDRFEDSLKKQKSIRGLYLSLPALLDDIDSEFKKMKIIIIDGAMPEEEVFKAILRHIKEIFWQKTGIGI
ncbi:MAG: dTMP kinase [Candidatus Tagabacteria bacterium RIFCSPLOWO2_01_FULL_39_11]|uniref:Thymidylate kinase n=1 Tax=Candidatus Tagabacteria bacterium RIFCSPLOWO2_01_FULL_39_11 TaxID=1802295 RepID=A0A1G2LRZ6_9BACT|nr:MAG: dTMP kinase [Candidatus Tagabacteria bacterium RIFCSPLOWO2_01_FULL_39_11]